MGKTALSVLRVSLFVEKTTVLVRLLTWLVRKLNLVQIVSAAMSGRIDLPVILIVRSSMYMVGLIEGACHWR